MSSPKRLPKSARGGQVLKAAAKIPSRAPGKSPGQSLGKSTGKSAGKSRAAALHRPSVAATDVSADADRLAVAIEHGIVEGRLDIVSAQALQKLMAAACRLYTARREAGEDFMPVPPRSIAATDVMVTASGLLRAADLAVFELGMWQNWTGR